MRRELGCVGHFIGGEDCAWHRHTQVPGYRISSIGEYRPRIGPGDNRQRTTIGAGETSFFETMVFKTSDESPLQSEGCGCCEVTDWCEVDGRRYATAGDAQTGHDEMADKYLAKKQEPTK